MVPFSFRTADDPCRSLIPLRSPAYDFLWFPASLQFMHHCIGVVQHEESHSAVDALVILAVLLGDSSSYFEDRLPGPIQGNTLHDSAIRRAQRFPDDSVRLLRPGRRGMAYHDSDVRTTERTLNPATNLSARVSHERSVDTSSQSSAWTRRSTTTPLRRQAPADLLMSLTNPENGSTSRSDVAQARVFRGPALHLNRGGTISFDVNGVQDWP